MAVPGLFLSRITSSEPVTGDRVDDHLSLMFGHVNGGLTAKNLAPSFRAPNSMFAESNSVFCLTGKTRNTIQDGGGGSVCVGQLAFSARVIGVSYAVSVVGMNFNPSTSEFNVLFGDGNTFSLVLAQLVEIPPPSTQIMSIDGSTHMMLAGYIPWQTSYIVPISSIMHAQFNVSGANVIGNLGIWFAASLGT